MERAGDRVSANRNSPVVGAPALIARTVNANLAARLGAQLLISLCGAWLLFLAARADDAWILSRVVLPHWFLPPTTLRGFHWARAGAALVGSTLLLVVGPKLGRWAGSQRWPGLGWGCIRTGVALLLSVAAAELVVRLWDSREPLWRRGKLEFRLGRPDPRFGWVLLPSRATSLKHGRADPVTYRIDAWGDRAASEAGAPDPELPSLVVAGESIAFGHGLAYEDTFAALVGKHLGLQVINVAVGGYGADQAYLRLLQVLGRLRQPAAVLIVFLPIQLGRALQDYRPRLVLEGGELQLRPAARGFWARWRLRDLWVNELPYLVPEALHRTMEVNKAIVRSAADAARSRGA
jgi:hypothetical protein